MAGKETLRVLRIVDGTSVDGPGLRTSIYFAGCTHHCPECHNPESWDPTGGTEMTVDEIMEHVREQDYNVSLSGGDPLFQATALLPLLKLLKEEERHVWCYTGYTYEQVASSPLLSPILKYIDVLVDGRFEISKRDISLLFKGSQNQRLVDAISSTPGNIRLWESNF